MSSSTDAGGPTRYAHLTFNAPLSSARADALVSRLAATQPTRAVDIGCGWAELLIRLAAGVPGVEAVGLDSDGALLARGRAAAAERGVAVRLVEGPADDLVASLEPADVVLCIGSSHALGADLPAALAALWELVRPGGRVVLGEGFWEPTGPVDETLVWDDVRQLPDLAGLVDRGVAAGFVPLWVERANADEWDAFESGYLADVGEWLVAGAPGAEPDEVAERRRAYDEHRERWLRGYRHGLGFAYVTLGRPVGS